MANNQVTREHSPQIALSKTEYYSAPIPRAEEFERYNNILPGAADRILAMAERQAAHRQNIEKFVIYGGTVRSIVGMVLGFILAVITILTGGYLIFQGRKGEGLVSIIIALVSLVGAFIYGTYQQKKERANNKLT